MAQTILITSGKGGVGKSVVCAHLGAALASCEQRVLLVEGSHRSLDVLFSVSERIVFDLKDVFERRREISDALVPLRAERLQLLCAPMGEPYLPEDGLCAAFKEAVGSHFDYVLIEVDGTRKDQLAAYAAAADRAVLVSTADPVCARESRTVSDALFRAGVPDIRLCINMLAKDFLRDRPVPDLDWMIDQTCAQLIAVIPFDGKIAASIGQTISLSNISKMIFDNFAQRIMGNYIDLFVQ